MPAIRTKDRVLTEVYSSIAAESTDNNDCAVKAVAIATGTAYSEVFSLFEAEGRVKGKGVQQDVINAVLKALGYKSIAVNPAEYIATYGGVHSDVLKNVTTHHPARFPHAFRDEQTYFFYSTGHVTCIVNGENHDWTKGRAKRAKEIHAIVPRSAKVSNYLKSKGAA
jgi:hypothetical protein